MLVINQFIGFGVIGKNRFRYWRITINSTHGPSSPGLYELELKLGGGSDLFTGGSASAESTSSGAASDVVDDDTGTQWVSDQAAPVWWKYDMGAGNEVSADTLRIYTEPAGPPGGRINAFILEVSNDDASYATVLSDSCTDTSGYQTFSF